MILKATLAGLLLHSTPASTLKVEPDREPNIVIVYIDDMGWNDIG